MAQHNEVHALDIIPEKVEKLCNYESPIRDAEIERFLAEAKAGGAEAELVGYAGRDRGLRQR